MDLRWSLVLCALAQVTCCGARSVPLQPLSFPNPLPRGCNDSDVLFFSGLALKHINADQQDGYVLGLNRVHDAWEHIQVRHGSPAGTGTWTGFKAWEKGGKPELPVGKPSGRCAAVLL